MSGVRGDARFVGGYLRIGSGESGGASDGARRDIRGGRDRGKDLAQDDEWAVCRSGEAKREDGSVFGADSGGGGVKRKVPADGSGFRGLEGAVEINEMKLRCLPSFALFKMQAFSIVIEDVEAQGYRHDNKRDQNWLCVIGDDGKNLPAVKSA